MRRSLLRLPLDRRPTSNPPALPAKESMWERNPSFIAPLLYLRAKADKGIPASQSALANKGDSAETLPPLQCYYAARHMQSEENKPGPPSWLRTILIGRKPKWTLIRIAILVATCYIVFGFLVLVIRIEGPSMLPTYSTGRINLVNRLAYMRREPQRRDIVAIRLSGTEYNSSEFVHDLVRFRLNFDRLSRPSVMYMKRIVGLPGETIEFAGGRLLVNGNVLDEPYVKSRYRWEMPPRKLGPDQYFVVGDNRSMAIDDHEHGVPLRNHIVGKVLL